MTRSLRILVVTRSYPAPGDLYQYPFVHRRVLAYAERGHEVAVFRPAVGASRAHDYEGVTCTSGDREALGAVARDFQPDVIAAHGLSETMWPSLEPLSASVPIGAWLHGSEIPDFFKQKAMTIASAGERARAMVELEERLAFWRNLLEEAAARLKLVFPSRSAVAMMREDTGDRLREAEHAVIPNPIDTDLFAYAPKSEDQRFRVLSIRPFDSPTYANDLSVAAILHLAQRPGFERLHFTIIGDGPLFDEILRPIVHLSNVTIRRQFLTQREIGLEHARHGIFLVPTRLDTQGVSRDEAMASGLVPVTNAIAAVREFADEDCAALAAPEDASGLADELWRMVEAPGLFQQRSAAAAERIRAQRSNERIIPAELSLLAEVAHE